MSEANDLHAEFDRGFAEPPVVQDETIAVLSVRTGTSRFALRRAQLASVQVGLSLVTLPTRARGLLGVIAVHGNVVPVWDLGVLAGRTPATRPRWFAIAAAEPVALAFDELIAHAHVPVAQLRRHTILDLDEVLHRA